tara:strand:+ start:953 stop:1417 length:465 start_codon:yes stop_codon:yes gene_type:complete
MTDQVSIVSKTEFISEDPESNRIFSARKAFLEQRREAQQEVRSALFDVQRYASAIDLLRRPTDSFECSSEKFIDSFLEMTGQHAECFASSMEETAIEIQELALKACSAAIRARATWSHLDTRLKENWDRYKAAQDDAGKRWEKIQEDNSGEEES